MIVPHPVKAVLAFPVLLCLTAAAWFPTAIAGEEAPPQAAEAEEPNPYLQQIIDAMNRCRAERGLTPLREIRSLDLAAQDRLRDMQARGYFDHVAPDGTQPWVWVDKHGYRYATAGENLAVGYRSAQSLVDAWMASPRHRDNILLPEFRDVGVAVMAGSPVRPFRGDTVVAFYGVTSSEKIAARPDAAGGVRARH